MKTPHQISASLVELLLGLMISRFLFQSRELSPVLWWTITHGLLDGLMQAEAQAQAPSSDESQAQAQPAAGAKRPTGPMEDLRSGNVGRSIAWAALAGMLMFAPWCLPMFGDTFQIVLMCAVTLASLGVRRTHTKALEAGSAVGAIVDGVWMGGMLSNPLRAVKNGLWGHLPTTVALTSTTCLGLRAASQVVDFGIDTALPYLGLLLSDAQEEAIRPWAKAAARLPFYCMPRVVVTKSGLIMQYPSLEGHIVQHGPNFEVHRRGPWVTERRLRPEFLATPEGIKPTQVTREYLITPNDTVMTGQTDQILVPNQDGQPTPVDLSVDIKSGFPVRTVTSFDPALQERWTMLWSNALRGEGMRALPEPAAAAHSETLTAPQRGTSLPLRPSRRFPGVLSALSSFTNYLPSLSSLPTLSTPQLTLHHVDNLLAPFILAASLDLARGRSPSLSTAAFAGLFSLVQVQGAWGQMEKGPYFLNTLTRQSDGVYSSGPFQMNDSSLIIPITLRRNNTQGVAVVLERWSSSGNLLWSTMYDEAHRDEVVAVFVTNNDDLYVGGYSTSAPSAGGEDMTLIIFNATNGQAKQAWMFGGVLNDKIFSISSRHSGGIYFTGPVNYTTYESNAEVLLGVLDEHNKLVCSVTFGGTGYDSGQRVSTIEGNNGAIVGGYLNNISQGRLFAFYARFNETCGLKQAMTIQFNPIGNVSWVMETYVAQDIAYAVGRIDHLAGNDRDIYVLKFNAVTFEILQSVMIDVQDAQSKVYSIRPTNNGKILIAGSTNSSGYWRPLYVKLDDDTLTLMWASTIDDGSEFSSGISASPMNNSDILATTYTYTTAQFINQLIHLDENGLIPGCNYVRSITSNVTVIPITPNVTDITSLLQVTPLNYTLRPWNVTFTRQYPIAETLCEFFPPTTAMETLLALFSSSPGSSYRWVLFAGGGLIVVCCLAGGGCIAAYMLRHGKGHKHVANDNGEEAGLSASHGQEAIVTALPVIPTSASSARSKRKPKGDQPQEEPYHNTHDVNEPHPPGEYNNLPGAKTLASAGFMSRRSKKSGPYVKCFVDPGGEGDEYANFPHGELYANTPSFT